MAAVAHDTINTAQGLFHYAEAGRGPAVLLLHDGGGTHRDWTYVFPILARRHRVIAPDLPGAGQSGRPREGYGRTTQGRAIVELLKALGEERVAVVGQGLGAFLAIEVAAANPYVVERLALISPVTGGLDGPGRRLDAEEALAEQQLYGGAGPAAERAERVARQYIASDEARRRYLEFAAQHGGASDADAVQEMLADAGRRRDDVLFRTLRCPVLVVRPERDTAFSRERAERIAALPPLGRLAELPDTGHFAAFERPEALADLLLAFLRER